MKLIVEANSLVGSVQILACVPTLLPIQIKAKIKFQKIKLINMNSMVSVFHRMFVYGAGKGAGLPFSMSNSND